VQRDQRVGGIAYDLTLIAACAFANGLGLTVFFAYLSKSVTSGEIGRKAGAEGATAPETLRQKDPRDLDSIWKEAHQGLTPMGPPTG
jgi:hypothetical protein